MKQKIVVGMSGGVDSSVAACLLKEQGYEVIGVTMQTWDDLTLASQDAEQVAKVLDIPYYLMDFKKEFKKHVMDYFVEEYLAGRTPNPCIACNRYIKWEALLSKARELGADFIATGHYARVEKLSNGRYAVKNSVTARKDQTYALFNLTQEQLAHTLMPIGEYTKDEIRQIALDHKLPIAEKPDSQDICFVPDGDYSAVIEREAPGRIPGEGNFIKEDGTILGTHKGITHYTVGQRKGLGLAMGKPVFVSKIRPATNEVVISDETSVFSSKLICNHINFMGMKDLIEPVRVRAKIRYAHKGEWCTLNRIEEDEIECVFDNPVRAITPGQAVVFYEGEYVMGGGIIK